MKKDFRNTLTGVFMTAALLIIGWYGDKVFLGISLQSVCKYGFCLSPEFFLLSGISILLIITIILIYI